MTKKVISLPEDRNAWTFGQCLAWHLFVGGTRPDGTSRLWNPKEARAAFQLQSARTLSYWLDDRHLPLDTRMIERGLFGDNPVHQAGRIEIREKLIATRARKRGGAAPGGGALAPVSNAGLLVVYEIPSEEDHQADDASQDLIPYSENFGKAPEVVAYQTDGNSQDPFTRDEAAAADPADGRFNGRLSGRAILVGVLILFGGYGWIRWQAAHRPGEISVPPAVERPESLPPVQQQQLAQNPIPNSPTPVRLPEAPAPTAAPPPVPDIQRRPTEDEMRAAEERRIEQAAIAARKAAFDAAERDRLEEAKRLDRAAADTAGRYASDQLEAVPVSSAPAASPPSVPSMQTDRPAASPATVSPDGVLQCPNGPVKVTGFKLSCDRMLAGGTTLGSAQLSYSVANINECAAKCRGVDRCIGFTYNAAQSSSAGHSCVIFGPRPEGRTVRGWVSGER